MKKILSMVLSLLLVLSLIGCTDPVVEPITSTKTTIAVESSVATTDTTLKNISSEEFESRYGISVEYLFDFDEQTFVIQLAWTNKLDYATSFYENYSIKAYQNEVELSSEKTSSYDIEAIHKECNPNNVLIVNLVYSLIDINEPVYLTISDTETVFHYDPFYPGVVG